MNQSNDEGSFMQSPLASRDTTSRRREGGFSSLSQGSPGLQCERDDQNSDITSLVRRLRLVLGDKEQYRRLLGCPASDAQRLLDSFQWLLDVQDLDWDFRKQLIVATQRISQRSGFYPTCYDLHIEHIDEHSVAAGGFADIFQGKFEGQPVCIKVIRVYQNTRIEHVLKQIAKEAILWGQLSHPNILPILGLFRLPPYSRACFVSQWMENGDITAYLEREPDVYRLQLVCDVANGLWYLHDIGVIHGDLKGPNILIDNAGRARLSDFGISSVSDAEIVKWTSQTHAGSKGGSIRWQAPELFDLENDTAVMNTVESDIYSFGCVCYEIFTGNVPFAKTKLDVTVTNMVLSGRRPERPSPNAPPWTDWGLTDDMWSLMVSCWGGDPAQRPSSVQIDQQLKATLLKDNRQSPSNNEPSPSKFRRRMNRLSHMINIASVDNILGNVELSSPKDEGCTIGGSDAGSLIATASTTRGGSVTKSSDSITPIATSSHSRTGNANSTPAMGQWEEGSVPLSSTLSEGPVNQRPSGRLLKEVRNVANDPASFTESPPTNRDPNSIRVPRRREDVFSSPPQASPGSASQPLTNEKSRDRLNVQSTKTTPTPTPHKSSTGDRLDPVYADEIQSTTSGQGHATEDTSVTPPLSSETKKTAQPSSSSPSDRRGNAADESMMPCPAALAKKLNDTDGSDANSLRKKGRGMFSNSRRNTQQWEKEITPDDHFITNGREGDLVIPIMGPTGAGKSTFINTLLGGSHARVGHGLQSETQYIHHYALPYPGRRIYIVEIPGFDDTRTADRETLRRIAVWMAKSYCTGMKVAGIIYLQEISQRRFTGVMRKNMDMFERLCGSNAATSATIATTKWNEVSLNIGQQREAQLRDEYWRNMLEHGSKMRRFEGTRDSAQRIVDEILAREALAATQIQEELVDLDKLLAETEAGRALRYTLKELLEQQKKMAERLRQEGGDDANVQLVKTDINIQAILGQIKDLEIPLGRKMMRGLGLVKG